MSGMFSNRDRQRIADTVYRDEARRFDGRQPDDMQRTPLPVLAVADANVAKFRVGTFSLYSNKPDGLVDSGDDRDAYALREINAGDDVQLMWYGGDASQGYWAANSAGVGTTTTPLKDPPSCCCTLITAMFDEGVITEEEKDNLNEIMECGEIQTVACILCDGGMPETWDITLAGFASNFRPSFDAWFNSTNRITMTGCEGSLAGPIDNGLQAVIDYSILQNLAAPPFAWMQVIAKVLTETGGVTQESYTLRHALVNSGGLSDCNVDIANFEIDNGGTGGMTGGTASSVRVST